MRRYLGYRPKELCCWTARVTVRFIFCSLLVRRSLLGTLRWRGGISLLRMTSGPHQHFRAAIWDAWRAKDIYTLTAGKGFREGGERVGPLLDYGGTRQLLFSSQLRERGKMLLRSILCGGVWDGFLLGKSKEEDVPCQFCVGRDGDGHFFMDCPFSPLVSIRRLPEFALLMNCDRGAWPRCLAWHGWLPAHSPRRTHPPWAVAVADTVGAAWESALGAFPVDSGGGWNLRWDPDDILDLADDVPAHPDI